LNQDLKETVDILETKIKKLEQVKSTPAIYPNPSTIPPLQTCHGCDQFERIFRRYCERGGLSLMPIRAQLLRLKDAKIAALTTKLDEGAGH